MTKKIDELTKLIEESVLLKQQNKTLQEKIDELNKSQNFNVEFQNYLCTSKWKVESRLENLRNIILGILMFCSAFAFTWHLLH